jgi:ankyrin repeat protein
VTMEHEEEDEDDEGWNATTLLRASKYGYLEVVNALIATGADVKKADEDGDTPISLASHNGHLLVVQALIAKIMFAHAAIHMLAKAAHYYNSGTK